MLTSEDIEKAKVSQDEYWEALHRNFTFFRDKDGPFSVDIFDLLAYNHFYDEHRSRYIETWNSGYVWIARYWANDYLNKHISTLYLEDFNFARVNGAPEIRADVWAENRRKIKIKKFQEEYP